MILYLAGSGSAPNISLKSETVNSGAKGSFRLTTTEILRIGIRATVSTCERSHLFGATASGENLKPRVIVEE